jgi:hypothetical protein
VSKRKPASDSARAARLASDHEPLKASDFDAGALNVGKRDAQADKEKKQEFSRLMGELHSAMRVTGGDISKIPPHLVRYSQEILPEQERRYQNRRVARSLSLTMANEALFLAQCKSFAEDYLARKIVPRGYAQRRSSKPIKRSVILFLSDLHLGADLSAIDNPIPFGAIQEARRLEFIVRQWFDYKPQHREHSEGVLLFGGDMIEGLLLHDLRDGAPLAEQATIFWHLLADVIGLGARAFPRLRVYATPGNHGRNKLRHQGRATSSKWDGIEWTLYYGLAQMAAALPNVTFEITRKPVTTVPLHGQNLLLTHGDTEVKLGHPYKASSNNIKVLTKLNATRRYGVTYDAVAVGHYHSAAIIPGLPGKIPTQVYNGMLVPPNGHARTEDYDDSPCGQYVWEAVEGFPVGDARFCAVDERTDADETLGKLIKPFRLP